MLKLFFSASPQYDFLLNTPDAFTPDGRWILGETPEVANYFVCAGMNGNSLQGAGGVGKAVADWIVGGFPPQEMLQFEVQRFTSLHNNSRSILSLVIHVKITAAGQILHFVLHVK